jgi:starch-binding outer membrane protein SusE/F
MKKITIYKFLALFVTAIIFLAACTKEPSDVKLDPKISTSQVLNVTSDSATVVGFLIAGVDGFTERGVCYDVAAGPTTAKSKLASTVQSIKATFPVRIGKLLFATKYYARAYGINSTGTIYGEEVSFTTLPVKATLTTTAVTSITGNSAMSGGNVTVAGGSTVTARGVCFGTTHNPTITGTKTTDGSGTGVFTSSLTSLKGNTLYYVRAYATSTAGTGYGPEVSFTTLVDLPVVTTTAVTAITKISAISGGNVTYDGGGTVSAKGLAWGTAANPTTSGSIIDGGTGTGVFVSNLTGLTKNTTYHVRAYATNTAGTAYGSDLSFTTLADINKFWVVGDYNGWDNSDNALYIISTATDPEAQGYIYFPASGGFKLTTDHTWSDASTFGFASAGVLTNPGGNIPVPAAGYYLIKANPITMTYSLTQTIWGIIGDATAGGWGTQTDMNYSTSSKNFWLGAHLTSGTTAFKFRGTSDWSVNYGATAGSNVLVAGGDNIKVGADGDYAITMDLSQPNNYTYSANTWGAIGDFNSWGGDAVMTWDAVNHVFTANITAAAAGAFKFRANSDWAINLGGPLGALTQGGDNIPITAGTYTLTLDPWAKIATVTLH